LYFLGVRLAEQNRLVEAIERFSQAIELNPQHPSPYNNRAQAYQLQSKTEGQLYCYLHLSINFILTPFLEAMADLSTAINLSSNTKNNQKILSLALTQRGILNRFLGKIRNSLFHVRSYYMSLSLGNEKESLDDFTRAAELGSAFAKQQVLLTNPYAAACNQMLSKMIKQMS
jgi:tetratricopeptide (TPR) repeat protein